MSFTCLQVLSAAGLVAVEKSGGEYLYRCPRHDDKHPSMKVNGTKDVWMCGPCGASGNPWQLAAFVAGIDPDNKPAVLTWLEDHQLINGFKNQKDSPWRVVKSYPYHNADGTIAFHIDRMEGVFKGKHEKKFQARPTGAAKLLYNLPAILSSSKVYIAEGEKCADALIALGLCATTNPFGAKKWSDSYASSFSENQEVVIFPDNDEPGVAHANQVASSLYGKVASVKIVSLPDLKKKEDVYDFIASRTIAKAAEDLRSLEEATSVFIPPQLLSGGDDGPAEYFNFPFNEMGMADWLTIRHPEITFNIDTKKWLYFNDSYWVEDPSRSFVTASLHQEIEYCRKQANIWFTETELKNFYKFLLGSGDARHVNAVLELASRKTTTRSSSFDCDPFLINFPNGTLDLRTGNINPHSFDDRISRCVPWVVEESDTPAWDSFVNFLCQGDAEFYAYLYRALGYCLSGDMSQHCMFLLWGPALNGKTTLIDTMIDLLGSGYARKASIQMLVRREDDCNPELAYCEKMRFVGISEGMNRRIDEELVKAITTGEWITTRQKYQLPRSFRPEFKLFFATNVRPAIATNDQGFWRRIHEWPMLRTLTEDQIDVDLKVKLMNEASGILFKIVQGWKDFWLVKKRKLLSPSNVIAAVAEHRVEASDLAAFVSEFIETVEPDYYTLAEDVYQAFKTWSGTNMSKVTVTRKLVGEFGFKSIKIRTSGPDHDKRAYAGIKLREVAEPGDYYESNRNNQGNLGYEH